MARVKHTLRMGRGKVAPASCLPKAADALGHGQAIEFEVDGRLRIAMVSSELAADADPWGATHLLEFVDSSPHLEEWTVRLDEVSCMLSGKFVPDGIPYTYKGCHLPSLPAHKQHHCTDPYFLLVFAAACAGFLWVAAYAISNGDLQSLHHAYDYKGRLCGVDPPVRHQKYAFWCMKAPHNSTSDQRQTKAHLLENSTLGRVFSHIFHLGDQATNPLQLRYPVCVSECPTSNETNHTCYDPYHNSTVVMADYPSSIDGMSPSPYCWPNNNSWSGRVKMARAKHPESEGKTVMLIPKSAWSVPPIAGVVAFLMGYAYFKLLEKCVDFIVMVFIFTATSLSVISGCIILFYSYYYGFQHWWLGVILVVVGGVACRVLFAPQAQADINKAAGCIEAACECINQEFSLLFEPMIALIFRLPLLLFGSMVLLLLVTCGDAKRLREGAVRERFTFSMEVKCYFAYAAFMLCWLMEMSTSFSQYVLAWVTERWYFTPYVGDKKLDWERRAVLKGYANAMRYHLGTMSKGSLLIMVLRFPRMAMKFLCGSRGECLAHVGKNAYLGSALTSEPFWHAARSADYMLNQNDDFGAVKWLNGLQGIFQFGGLVVICASTEAVVQMLCHLSNLFGHDVVVEDFITNIAILTSISIGLGYMTLFDTVGDTILYCWAVQQTRYNYHYRHQIRATPVPGGSPLETAYGLLFGEDYAEDCTAKVNYAPLALRELVLGRHRKLASLSFS